jgi:hypothetical protein
MYYPAEYTHVFQKYWDVLNDPDHTKASMSHMSRNLSSMDLNSWEPQVDADAPEKSYRVAHNAALSRRCPIQDAVDYWLSPGSGSGQVEAVPGLGGPAPGQDRHNVDT